MAVDRGANHRLEARLKSWYPRRSVADSRRATCTGLMTLRALGAHDLLGRCAAPASPSCRWAPPSASGLVDHVGDGALDFEVGEARVAPVRRHLADTLERTLGQAGKTLRCPLAPCFVSPDLRCTPLAGSVACRAHGFDDFLCRFAVGSGTARAYTAGGGREGSPASTALLSRCERSFVNPRRINSIITSILRCFSGLLNTPAACRCSSQLGQLLPRTSRTESVAPRTIPTLNDSILFGKRTRTVDGHQTVATLARLVLSARR